MNYYQVLEIDPGASTAEIERAFRRLAREVHPDLTKGDRAKAEARMKQLNEIRDTLADPLLRAGYDERLRLERERERARPTAPPAAAQAPRRPAQEPRAEGPPSEEAARWSPVAVAPVSAPRRSGASSGTPWLMLVLGASAASAAVWHWRHDLPWAEAAPAAQLAPAEEALEPAPPPKAQTSVRARPRDHVVHIGSGVGDVIRAFGAPDRVEPGKRSGDATMYYGTLKLEIVNGRVASGAAP